MIVSLDKFSYVKIFLLYVLVGEPLNKEAWEWYYQVVGEERCDVVDTWWQTGGDIN